MTIRRMETFIGNWGLKVGGDEDDGEFLFRGIVTTFSGGICVTFPGGDLAVPRMYRR